MNNTPAAPSSFVIEGNVAQEEPRVVDQGFAELDDAQACAILMEPEQEKPQPQLLTPEQQEEYRRRIGQSARHSAAVTLHS